MARSRSVARPILEKILPFWETAASNVQVSKVTTGARNASNYTGFAWDMEWTWHLNARFALQKYGFGEFMVLSSLKNRLRSRTRVTTFKFQSALDLKNRLRSRTRVTTLMFKYVLETRLRACIQRAVFRIHELKAKP